MASTLILPGIYPLWTGADLDGQSEARMYGCWCTDLCRWFFWNCHVHRQLEHRLQKPANTHTHTHRDVCVIASNLLGHRGMREGLKCLKTRAEKTAVFIQAHQMIWWSILQKEAHGCLQKNCKSKWTWTVCKCDLILQSNGTKLAGLAGCLWTGVMSICTAVLLAAPFFCHSGWIRMFHLAHTWCFPHFYPVLVLALRVC